MLAPATPPPKVQKALAATARRENLMRMARALWPVLIAAAIVALAGRALALLGPVAASLVSGCVLVALGYFTVRAWRSFEPEDDYASARRLEAFHGVSDIAPLTGLGDRPISGDASLWRYQAGKSFAVLPSLNKPVPWPVTRRDGLGLLALVIVSAGALSAPDKALSGFRFDLSPLVGDGPISVAIVATPPAYTGLPAAAFGQSGDGLVVPAGSVLSIRVDGPRGAPRIGLAGGDRILHAQADGSWQGRVTLEKSTTVSVKRFGTRGAWPVQVTPDQAPRLDGEVKIEAASQGRLQASFTAIDDYGLASAAIELVPEQKIATLPQSLIEPLLLTLPRNRERIGSDDGAAGEALSLFAEARRHRLAGRAVKARLVITDGAGQTARSAPISLVLPEFEARTAIAAALLEIRTDLMLEGRAYQRGSKAPVFLRDPTTQTDVAFDLSDRLAFAPEGVRAAEAKLAALHQAADLVIGDPISVAGMAMILSQLRAARSTDEAFAAEAELWALAMRLNGTGGTPAQQAIAEARDALADALENGASASEVEQRMDDLRAAVGQRLQELAQEQGSTPEDMQVEQPGGEAMSAADLAEMLDQLEDSGTSGDSGSALEQLAQLDQLLENLQSGGQGGGGQAGGEQAGEGGGSESGESGGGQAGGDTGQGGGGGDGITETLRQQEALSDQTVERDAGARQDGRPVDNLDDLASEQGALAQRLREQEVGGDGNAGEAEAAKQAAADAMDQAAQALALNDASAAREAQRRATQALRNARRLANQGSSNGQSSGQSGQAGGERDPLGRSSDQFGDGSETRVPDQIERRQARDIRDLLRRRQAEPDRSEEERGYIERLLEGF